MNFAERLKQHIEKKNLLKKEEKIIVSLSGGADSVALLCALSELGYDCCAYHLNHSLRGEEADGDEQFCRTLCEISGILFFSEKVDVLTRAIDEKISFEDAGRRVRYEGLARLSFALGNATVVTGHHMGDFAETFIMNAMRGAGLDGLCSIPEKSVRIVKFGTDGVDGVDGNEYDANENEYRGYGVEGDGIALKTVRPLLPFRHAELAEYLESRGIRWREDSTNQSGDYLRNRVRKFLDAASVKKINDCILLLRQDRDFIDGYVEERVGAHMKAADDGKHILLIRTEQLHPSVFSRLIRKAVSVLAGDTVNLSGKSVTAAMNLNQPGSMTEIGSGDRKISVYRTYEGLEFSLSSDRITPQRSAKASEATSADEAWVQLEDGRENPRDFVRMREIREEEFAALKMTDTRIVMDADKVRGMLKVRSRMTGDVIVPFGMRGHKTVKKLLIDEKVDRRLRDRLAVVYDDEKIVWVAGVRMSDLVRVDDAGGASDTAVQSARQLRDSSRDSSRDSLQVSSRDSSRGSERRMIVLELCEDENFSKRIM